MLVGVFAGGTNTGAAGVSLHLMTLVQLSQLAPV